MPFITDTQNAKVRAANTVMTRAFFPRAKKWLYPTLAGSYTSTSLVEPHVITGSFPHLQKYKGFMRELGIPSWTFSVPNPLHKAIATIPRSQLEGDQTKVLFSLSAQAGVRLAEYPDALFAYKLLKGSTTGEGGSYETFEGTQYASTFDGVSFFNAAHPDYGAGTQSNILQGELPATNADVLADDWATNAVKMQRDLQAAIAAFQSYKDNQGVQIFPTLDPEANIVVVVPPTLKPVAELAFRSPGSVINQTTNIAPKMVKAVLSHGYLAGVYSIDDGTLVTPVNETDYYFFVVDDWVKPLYMQLYRPPANDELFPPDYDVGAEIDRVMASGSNVTVDQATLWATAMVETTFAKSGANADHWTITNEAHVVSPRWRGNAAYGPWFNAIRVKPVGGS